MTELDALAQSLNCLESTDKNTFQRMARVLQAIWREEHSYPVGKYRGRDIGSYLEMPWAEETLANFLDDDIRNVVSKVLCSHSGVDRRVIERNRLFSNLLSSQPLAFNLFAHLKLDLPLATQALSHLTDGRIAEVASVDFEYSPGRGDSRYTGDNSAFDVYVRFRTPAGLPGFAGIEVKYHESLNYKPARHRSRYDEVAEKMQCFDCNSYELLRRKPLQQIWRDHLLCGAHKCVDGFADGIFVFLSPQANESCNKAVAAYKECLISDNTFLHLTIEDVVSVLRRFSASRWVDLFSHRYLSFEKINRHHPPSDGSMGNTSAHDRAPRS